MKGNQTLPNGEYLLTNGSVLFKVSMIKKPLPTSSEGNIKSTGNSFSSPKPFRFS